VVALVTAAAKLESAEWSTLDAEDVMLLLTAGTAKAQLASAATTRANEACIFVKWITAIWEKETLKERLGLEALQQGGKERQWTTNVKSERKTERDAVCCCNC
jgi:hypothetical protein